MSTNWGGFGGFDELRPYRLVVKSGDLEAFKALIPLTELPFPSTKKNKRLMALAAQHGQLPILQWLRQNGCPWDAQTPCWAARGGHRDVLEWCHANDCPWDDFTSLWAAMDGDLPLLQWVIEQGCPWNRNAICEGAASNNHWHVLHWVLQTGPPPFDLPDFVDYDPDQQFFLARQWLMDHHGICPEDREIHMAWLRTVEETSTHVLELFLCRDVVGLVRQYC